MTVLLAVGCSKYEQRMPGLISFSAALQAPQTKGDITDVTLGTYAWKTSAAWGATHDTLKLKTQYISNQETQYSSSAWHPGTYRWPTAGYLHFVCYGPHKQSSPISYDLTNGVTIEDYTASGEDLVYSNITTDCKESTGAAITLKHALSQVVIKLKTDEVPSGVASAVKSYKVTLTSLSLDSLKNKGSFSGGTWSSLSGKTSKSLFSGSKVLSTDFDSSIAAVNVMPQTFDDSLQSISLSYKVDITYTNNSSTTATFNNEVHYLYGLTSADGWSVGSSATYLVTISAFSDTLKFDGSVQEWGASSIVGNLGGV